jgi:hypothetical protein
VRVTRGASVTIRDLTIQLGRGVRNEGRLTVRDSVVRRSSFSGIENHPHARLTLVDSVVRNNAGGGIFNIGTLHITASRIVRNSTPYFGGGIYNSYGSQVTLTDSTISGNHARRRGGGVYSGDPASGTGGEQVTLINTTVTGNFAGDGGGGVAANEPWGLTMDAPSSVSANSPDDCSPPGLC